MAKVGYAKLGRSIPLDHEDLSSIGGDIEVVNLFQHLQAAGHEIHLVGRNKSEKTYPRVVNHWGPGSTFDGIPRLTNPERGDNYVDSPTHPSWVAYKGFIDEAIMKIPDLDAVVIWLGQHGTNCSFLPYKSGKPGHAIPQQSAQNYLFPLIRYINVRKIKPIWLCPDPRNTIKFRDLADTNQRPVLAQYDDYRNSPFFDYENNLSLTAKVEYKYSGIELLAVPGDKDRPLGPNFREKLFGILVNEGRTGWYSGTGSYHRVAHRLTALKHWVAWELPLRPDENKTKEGKWMAANSTRAYGRGGRTSDHVLKDWEIVGHWSDDSMVEMGRMIEPVPIDQVGPTLQQWRATITLPANNSGWATAKPWECFAWGTICFKHPKYDDQEHIYNRNLMPENLYDFLTPKTPREFHERVELLKVDAVWHNYANLQQAYLEERLFVMNRGAREVERAINKG